MAVDLSVFDKVKTFDDYQRLEQEFQLKKQLAQQNLALLQSGAKLPAAMQLANAYQQKIAAGDIEGANALAQFAKTVDKGVMIDQTGSYQALPGYAPAVGEIEGTKAGAKQQAEKDVDVVMNPLIVGGESAARNRSELEYAAPIAEQKETGKMTGEVAGGKLKKQTQAGNMIDLVEEAKILLPKATSGRLDTVGKAGKAIAGISDEKTQADNQLGVIAAGLVSNVPRMEGPQSDKDVIMYREAAGDIANTNKPYKDRLAALETIEKLQQKYAGGINSPQGSEVVLQPALPQKGDVVDGYLFMGGDAADPKNWRPK